MNQKPPDKQPSLSSFMMKDAERMEKRSIQKVGTLLQNARFMNAISTINKIYGPNKKS